MDLLPAEAETYTDGPVAVPVADTDILVPPLSQWSKTAIYAALGDHDHEWAALVLDPNNWETWVDVDPTVAEADTMWADWERLTGQDLDDIGRMVTILDQHARLLESDLVRWCGGQDLRHLWMPAHGPSRLTWRRLAMFYDGLPPESLTKTAQVDALDPAALASMAKRPRQGFGPWSSTDMRLAALEDAVNQNTYVLRLANADPKKARQIRPPEPVFRPGVTPKRAGLGCRPKSDRALRALAHMRANHGSAPAGWTNTKELPPATSTG